MDQENTAKIAHWRVKHGGHNTRPAGHALKTLGECVELCIAAGANITEISQTVHAEIDKATNRGEFKHEFDFVKVCEEVADVDICLEMLCQHNIISRDKAISNKIPILDAREWEADKDGVLRRPGRKNT